VRADEDDLVGLLAAAKIGDDVRRRRVRQLARREHEVHPHALAALEQAMHEHRVLRRHRRGRDARQLRVVAQ
jgi:hypothetical protein